MKEKTGILFSGGKDSCLALFKYGKEKIDVLLSIIPESNDSWMYHKPDLKLLRKQAEMLDLPLITEKSKLGKEKELEDLKKLIRKSRIKRLIIGGLASNYQGNRIKKICSELRVKVTAPLWGYSPEQLWQELFANGFKVIITKIACEGLSKDFIGKIIDEKRLEELRKLAEKYKFRLDFEGGEAETAVLYMPGMKREIKISYKIKNEERYRHLIKLIQIK